MDVWGWILFLAGGLAAVAFGGIGFDGVANLAGTLLGCALLISGSVFIAMATVRNALTVNLMINGRQVRLKPVGEGKFVGQGERSKVLQFNSLEEASRYYTPNKVTKTDRQNEDTVG